MEFVKLGLLSGIFQLLEGYNVNPQNWPWEPGGTPVPGEKLKAWGNSAWNQEHPGYQLPPTPTPIPPTATATPTETATATSTPTMTLTPTPAPCVPGIMPADIVLVVDRSGSMTGEKLAGAKQAANVFLEQVKKSRDDRVALVAFDQTAGTLVHLTRDWKALGSAIQGLEPGLGTYINLALKEASDELTFAKVPDRGQVIILLSDGGQNGPVSKAELIKMAEDMKVANIIIFTIGLGSLTNADEDTLKAMAFSPDHYYKAPTGADLAAIYQKIAIAIPCGTPTPAP